MLSAMWIKYKEKKVFFPSLSPHSIRSMAIKTILNNRGNVSELELDEKHFQNGGKKGRENFY
jgi:hypothetical protein